MWLLTLRDMSFRASRFVVVMVGTAVVFTLLFLMTGLVEQFNQEPFLTVDAIGAGYWVLPEGVSGPFTASSTLGLDRAEAVEAEGGADPVLVARGTLDVKGEAEEVMIVGHVSGGIGAPQPSVGRAADSPGEAVVDETAGASVGDRLSLGGYDIAVVGISRDTTLLAGLPVVFLPIDDARRAVFGGSPVVSAVLTSNPPSYSPPGTAVLDADAVGEDALGPLKNAISSVDLIRGLLWVVAAIIIGAVMYLSALERQRDFAVLKAVGGTTRQLGSGLAAQAVIIAVVAVAIAAGLAVVLTPVFPLKVRVPARAFWELPLLAVIVAVLAALAGIRRVRRADPAAAFSGP